MEFNVPKTHELFRQMIREFVEKEVKPIAAEVDENERFPMETVEKMAKIGIMGIPIPKQYGGAGGDNLMYAMAVEELSKACGTTGVIVSAHTSLGTWPILKFGNEKQKQKYLPKMASGEWILNGAKIFITNAGYAHVYVVFAMTDKSKGLKGISAFIVEAGTPGFSIGKKEMKLGIRGSATCELIFENCRIPKENLLGDKGKGFKIAMMTLDGGRIGIASQALGIAAGALEEAINYAKERKQFGRSLAQFQNTQFQIANLDVKVEAARLLVYKAAWRESNNLPYSLDAARAKLFAAETAMEVTTKAVQIFGGYGYTREYPVERMMRDAKITEIYEGTSEVQRMVIAANIIK